MGLKDLYDKAVATGVGLASENPEIAPPKQGNPEAQFKGSSLDLESPQPLGGPINVPYNTQIGTEYKSFNTTQPYLPKTGKTYQDSFQDPRLIARATDPIK